MISQDLRNHGTSPHAPEVSYTDLAGDVGAYIQNQKLDDVVLMGHSMQVSPLLFDLSRSSGTPAYEPHHARKVHFPPESR